MSVYRSSSYQIVQNSQKQQQQLTCIVLRQKIMAEEKLSSYHMFE